MSRTARKKTAAEEEGAAGACAIGQVVLMDISGDAAFRPPADVNETAEFVVVRMELPGVPVKEMDVRVRGSRIEVLGEKRPDACGDDASYLCLERAFGRFHRAFEVSGPVNLARMTAVLRGGVLCLAIPKCHERRGQERRVAIREEEDR